MTHEPTAHNRHSEKTILLDLVEGPVESSTPRRHVMHGGEAIVTEHTCSCTVSMFAVS